MPPHNTPRNIYIVGAQSTGKTTLVEGLRHHFYDKGRSCTLNGHHIPRPKISTELARIVISQYQFTAADIAFSPPRCLALQQLILQAQFETERALEDQGGWFISDRSGVDPVVYAGRHVSVEAARVLMKGKEYEELRERMRGAVVVICEAGMDWLKDDGVRLVPGSREEWVEFHRFFCGCLDEFGIRYHVLPCTVTSHQERVEFVVRKWEHHSSIRDTIASSGGREDSANSIKLVDSKTAFQHQVVDICEQES